MYKFVNQLNELRKSIIHYKFIEIALDLVIILLLSLLVFHFLGVKNDMALILPILIYLFIILKYKFRFNLIRIIEEGHPVLKERLSTAYDNKEQTNVVVDDLARSVLNDMDRLKYSSFISVKKIAIRVAIILALLTFVLFLTIPGSPLYQNEVKTYEIQENKQEVKTINGSSTEIFGEPAYIIIGNESQRVIIYRGSGSEPNRPGENREIRDYSRLFPQEESAITSTSRIFDDSVPRIYQEIVKNYFMNISRE